MNKLKKIYRRNKRAWTIKKAIKCSMKEAKAMMDEARKVYHIPNKQYMEEMLYYLPIEELGNERKRYIKIVSKQYNKPYGEAYHYMMRAKDLYGISHLRFGRKELMKNPTDSEFKRIQEEQQAYRERMINRVCAVTGQTPEAVDAEMRRVTEELGVNFIKYTVLQLYRNTDEEILEKKAEWKKEKNALIRKVRKITGWTREEVKAHMAEMNVKYLIDDVHYVLFRCWELTEEELETYATFKVSYKLCDKYNGGSEEILDNKLLFNEAYKDFIGRKYWINRDSSLEEFKEFLVGLEAIFLKPLDLSSGRGMERVEVQNMSEQEVEELYHSLMKEPKMLVEEFIRQHPVMSAVYPSCVNTVRVYNIEHDGKCDFVGGFVKFGTSAIIDNFASGGLLGGLDMETGCVNTQFINRDGELFDFHPTSGVDLRGFQIPMWDEIRKVTEAATRAREDLNFIGWDVAICEDKICIVEGNSHGDLGSFQAIYAPAKQGKQPLFEQYL